jgi:hypothetical protein
MLTLSVAKGKHLRWHSDTAWYMRWAKIWAVPFAALRVRID